MEGIGSSLISDSNRTFAWENLRKFTKGINQDCLPGWAQKPEHPTWEVVHTATRAHLKLENSRTALWNKSLLLACFESVEQLTQHNVAHICYSITPRIRVLPEKLTGPQPVKDNPRLLRNPKIPYPNPKARHLSPFWAKGSVQLRDIVKCFTS